MCIWKGRGSLKIKYNLQWNATSKERLSYLPIEGTCEYSAKNPRWLRDESESKWTSILFVLLTTGGGSCDPQNWAILFPSVIRSPLYTATKSKKQLWCDSSSKVMNLIKKHASTWPLKEINLHVFENTSAVYSRIIINLILIQRIITFIILDLCSNKCNRLDDIISQNNVKVCFFVTVS